MIDQDGEKYEDLCSRLLNEINEFQFKKCKNRKRENDDYESFLLKQVHKHERRISKKKKKEEEEQENPHLLGNKLKHPSRSCFRYKRKKVFFHLLIDSNFII